jgi:hypothetical protein
MCTCGGRCSEERHASLDVGPVDEVIVVEHSWTAYNANQRPDPKQPGRLILA